MPPDEPAVPLPLLLVTAAAPSLGALAALWWWPAGAGPVVYALCKTVLYGIPAAVAWKTVPRAAIATGLRRGLAPSALGFGLISGATVGAALLALWHVWLAGTTNTASLTAVVAEAGIHSAARYWLFGAWLSLGNSLLEELVFRWFMDSRLAALGLARPARFALSASIFTTHHVIVLSAFFDPPLVLLGTAGVFVGGLLWSWSLERWRSVVPGWISHILVDLAIFLVGASILGFGP